MSPTRLLASYFKATVAEVTAFRRVLPTDVWRRLVAEVRRAVGRMPDPEGARV